MLTYQQNINATDVYAPIVTKNDNHDHLHDLEKVQLLNMRWNQIRIAPLHEELKLFTSTELKIFFQAPPARAKIIHGIYIDVPKLPKAIEAIGVILAFQWGMLSSHHLPTMYSKLLKNPIDLLTATQQADKFSAIFLAHFDYDIQKVTDYLNNTPTLPDYYHSTEANSLRAKKIVKTYKKALEIKHQHEKKWVVQQMIPISSSHYAMTADISETNSF